MALLNKLTTDGSLLSGLDGKKPLEYNKQTIQIDSLDESQLDVGVVKAKYQYLGLSLSNYKKGLAASQLDLDGKTPSKYLDNLPK